MGREVEAEKLTFLPQPSTGVEAGGGGENTTQSFFKISLLHHPDTFAELLMRYEGNQSLLRPHLWLSDFIYIYIRHIRQRQFHHHEMNFSVRQALNCV